MNKVIYTIRSSRQLAGDIFEVVLEGDTSALTAPGQFINFKIDGLYLRRPISVYDYNEKENRNTAPSLVAMESRALDALCRRINRCDPLDPILADFRRLMVSIQERIIDTL